MAAPVPTRVHSIKTFKMGTDEYNTIKEVSHTKEGSGLYDAGDVDANESLVGRGLSRNSFTITMSDPIQAEALYNHAAANIVFDGVDAADASKVRVTMANAIIFTEGGRHATRTVAGYTVSGRADTIVTAAVP